MPSSTQQQFFKDRQKTSTDDTFFAQCYLLRNIDRLIKEKKITDPCYKNFLSIGGDPSVFLGRIFRNSKKEKFLNEILPHELSSLVPKIRLFKVRYDPNNPKNYKQFEYFFDNHMSEMDVQQIISNQELRGTGVGLKHCNWEFIGSNPAESKRLIKVSMSIIFSSVQDLLKKGENDVEFIEFIKPPDKSLNIKELDQKFQSVKLEIGWSEPDITHVVFKDKPDLRKAIVDSKLSMFLTLIDHKIKFEQEGKVTMDIQFWGRLESRFEGGGDTNFDILELLENFEEDRITKNLYTSEIERIKNQVKLFDCLSKNKAQNPIQKRNINRELKRELKNLQDINQGKIEFDVSVKKKKYEHFLKKLLESNKIYYKSFSEKSLENLKTQQSSNIFLENFDNVEQACVESGVKSVSQKYLENFKNNINLTYSNKSFNPGKLLDSRIPRSSNCAVIHYFFLGDLLDIVLDKFYKTENRLERFQKEYFSRFLIGSIANPFDHTKEKISLADIPISLQVFTIWFHKKVIKPSRERYPFNEFIRDLITELVQPLFNNSCVQNVISSNKKTYNSQIKPRITSFQLLGKGPSGKIDPITNIDAPYSEHIQTRRCESINNIKPENIQTIKITGNDDKFLDRGVGINTPPFDYYFIYATEEIVDYRDGDYRKDVEDGIYHFYIGADRGMIKNIEFHQNSVTYYKEAVMQGTGLEWLKRMYNAKVRMYGECGFIPGMKIFINPETVGIGKPGKENSISSKLGLGGYYVIIKVSGQIESGKNEVELECVWESRGDKFGFKSKIGSQNKVDCFQKHLKSSNNSVISKGEIINLINSTDGSNFKNITVTDILE